MNINKQQLIEMVKLQNRMNCKIDPNWTEKGRDWELAILVESVEAIEHHGWKWWKNQEIDLPQLQIELVDIWHFILSEFIEDNGELGAIDVISVALEEDFLNRVYLDDSCYCFNDLDLISKLRLLAGIAAIGRVTTELELFQNIMVSSGLSWDELYKLYIGKNILNTFRQDNGYKKGTYIKNWFGAEDNVVLDSILKDTPSDSIEFANAVYNKLKANYSEVVNFSVV